MTDEAALDENMPPIEEVVEETTETIEAVEVETTESAPADVDTTDEHDGVQKRINKAVAKQHAAIRRAEAAEQKLADIEANKVVQQPAEPKLEDFDYDDAAFNKATIEYHSQKAVSEAVNSYQTEQKKAVEQSSVDEVVNAFNVKEAEYIASHPEYSEDVVNLPPLPNEVLMEVYKHEKGAEIAHYLSKHLDVADGINLMKLGEIAARLGATKPTKQPSAAPEPVTPVKPGATLNKDMSDMSMEEIYNLE